MILSTESGFERVCRKGAIYDTKLHNLEEFDGILQKCVYENVLLHLVYESMEPKEMLYLKRSLVVYIFLMISDCSECVARVTISHGGTSSCIVNCLRVSCIHLYLGKVFPPFPSNPTPLLLPPQFHGFSFAILVFCFVFALLLLLNPVCPFGAASM